jgi:hypothetical protein
VNLSASAWVFTTCSAKNLPVRHELHRLVKQQGILLF